LGEGKLIAVRGAPMKYVYTGPIGYEIEDIKRFISIEPTKMTNRRLTKRGFVKNRLSTVIEKSTNMTVRDLSNRRLVKNGSRFVRESTPLKLVKNGPRFIRESTPLKPINVITRGILGDNFPRYTPVMDERVIVTEHLKRVNISSVEGNVWKDLAGNDLA
jgi:hypothetical protein